ncbi:MAG: hypothetical protein J6P88_02565, partial [Clostridia bacterium]|nr:hypothetical protein [Clostridia bacterium]
GDPSHRGSQKLDTLVFGTPAYPLAVAWSRKTRVVPRILRSLLWARPLHEKQSTGLFFAR